MRIIKIETIEVLNLQIIATADAKMPLWLRKTKKLQKAILPARKPTKLLHGDLSLNEVRAWVCPRGAYALPSYPPPLPHPSVLITHNARDICRDHPPLMSVRAKTVINCWADCCDKPRAAQKVKQELTTMGRDQVNCCASVWRRRGGGLEGRHHLFMCEWWCVTLEKLNLEGSIIFWSVGLWIVSNRSTWNILWISC